mmetsp:Transcript_15024/g.32725  ORF Transcript_15024/g.32725 Transcript_15024/m.32725 type:complete len:127 (+) Transcript_15024:797-1177(+)
MNGLTLSPPESLLIKPTRGQHPRKRINQGEAKRKRKSPLVKKCTGKRLQLSFRNQHRKRHWFLVPNGSFISLPKADRTGNANYATNSSQDTSVTSAQWGAIGLYMNHSKEQKHFSPKTDWRWRWMF